MIDPKNQLSWAVPYLVLILYQVHGANVSIGNAITNYYPTYAEIAISQILNTLKLIKLLKSSLTFKIVSSTIYMKLDRFTWGWKVSQEVGKVNMKLENFVGKIDIMRSSWENPTFSTCWFFSSIFQPNLSHDFIYYNLRKLIYLWLHP